MEMKGSYKYGRALPRSRSLVCDMEMKGSYKERLAEIDKQNLYVTWK